VISLAVTFWTLSHHSTSTSSGFQAGNCINHVLGSRFFTIADCSGTHVARIDRVLSTSKAICSPADTELVIKPPNPNLCVNFNDHNP
jgi:hypothetical protein